MNNPAAEILDQAGMGLKEFVDFSGVAQTTVQETLWGFFQDVPPSVSVALSRVVQDHGLDYAAIFAPEAKLNDAYRLWQKQERQKLRGTVTAMPSFQAGDVWSPFSFFVSEVTPTGVRSFCKLLKVPRATTQRYMQGATRNMPSAILEALQDVEYPHIKALREAQNAWL